MKINKNVSISAQIQIEEKVVAHLGANFSTTSMSCNINYTVTDIELAKANTEYVKEQYAEFEATVDEMAKDLGYVI